MIRIRWNMRKIMWLSVICISLYLIFSCGVHKYQIETLLSNTSPDEIVDYVADFSKMKLLNPRILDFTIMAAEDDHIHDWRYTVKYTERLSHWPYWLNTATANYIVTKTLPGLEPRVHRVESKHVTCFFKGAYCLHASSQYIIGPYDDETFCLEKIEYECPTLLRNLCRSELEFQRKAVMHNLTKLFSKRTK